MFDLKDIVSIAIGTALGGVISWYVTHAYWRRSKVTESITKELRQLNQSIFSGLRSFVVIDRNPQYFSSDARVSDVVPLYDTSKPDFPQVEWCRIPAGVKAGSPIKVLFKIVDIGLNFENPQGARITDHKSRVIDVESAGFGCMFGTVHTDLDDTGKKIILTVVLKDMPENHAPANATEQKISFFVT